MRINARLDEAHSLKLEKLKKINNLGVSDIIKQAIDIMYEQQSSAPAQKLSGLLESEFIGMANASEDLSTNYKQMVTRGLNSKYDTDR